MKYVVGFIIVDKKEVLLILKNRPAVQVGKLNGIGGKIEENETPLEAMIRETKEESNLDILNWEEIKKISFKNGNELFYFKANVNKKDIKNLKSLTDENVLCLSIKDLNINDCFEDFSEILN